MDDGRGKDILAILIVVLVGLGSFGLGRLSKNTINTPDKELKIEYNPTSGTVLGAVNDPQIFSRTVENKIETPIQTKSTTSTRAYFASSRGTKYYHLGCSGGKTLKEENKIWFMTKAEAEAAGYELSTSCK